MPGWYLHLMVALSQLAVLTIAGKWLGIWPWSNRMTNAALSTVLCIGMLAALVAIPALFVPSLAAWREPAQTVAAGSVVAGVLTCAGFFLYDWSRTRPQKWLEFCAFLTGVMIVVSGVWLCLHQWFSVLEGL